MHRTRKPNPTYNPLKIDDGDTLQIMVLVSQGSSIFMEAKILRTWVLPDGKGHGVATRFCSLSTRDEMATMKSVNFG
jgi:hypothetical protein